VQYKAIFFDWGGVIGLDPDDNFLGNLLLSMGASEEQKEEILDTYKISFMKGEISEKEYWDALRQKYGLSIHDSISDEFKRWKGLQANQVVLNLAIQAKAQNIKIAVLSNVIEPTYAVIKEAGYYDLFDDVIASCKVGYAKPEEEIYLIALKRLGVKSEESIFIDDKEKCIVPAKELGFTTILFNNQQQLVEDLGKFIDLKNI
jgi:epoxide hydrolase-like predicted phosphatase